MLFFNPLYELRHIILLYSKSLHFFIHMIVYFKQTFHQFSLSCLKLPILSYSMHKKQTKKQIKKNTKKMPMWKARYRNKKTCNLTYTSISMLCVYYEIYLNKLKINTEKNDLPHNSTYQTIFFSKREILWNFFVFFF